MPAAAHTPANQVDELAPTGARPRTTFRRLLGIAACCVVLLAAVLGTGAAQAATTKGHSAKPSKVHKTKPRKHRAKGKTGAATPRRKSSAAPHSKRAARGEKGETAEEAKEAEEAEEAEEAQESSEQEESPEHEQT